MTARRFVPATLDGQVVCDGPDCPESAALMCVGSTPRACAGCGALVVPFTAEAFGQAFEEEMSNNN